jgi:hypothetical protein
MIAPRLFDVVTGLRRALAKIDRCSLTCEHLKVVFHGCPDDWDWGCKKHKIILRQVGKNVLQCKKCKDEGEEL